MSSFNTPDESVQDTVAQLITGQNDANVTYDDTADQLSVDVSTLTDEEVQDIVASFVSSDSNLSWSYDDGNDTLAVSLANSILVNTLEATDVLNAPKYPTRSDVPDKEGIYRVEDVDGEGNFGIIAREI